MRGSGNASRFCEGRPTLLGNLMGPGRALVFRNALGLTQARWGQALAGSRKIRYSTSLRASNSPHTIPTQHCIVRPPHTLLQQASPTQRPLHPPLRAPEPSTTFGARSDVCQQMTKPLRRAYPPGVRHTSGGQYQPRSGLAVSPPPCFWQSLEYIECSSSAGTSVVVARSGSLNTFDLY